MLQGKAPGYLVAKPLYKSRIVINQLLAQHGAIGNEYPLSLVIILLSAYLVA